MTSIDSVRDAETTSVLQQLLDDETIRKNRVENVRTILVILSGRSIAFDDAALRQKILMTYPEAKVFFMSTEANPMGEVMPASGKIDLVIDFTGPGHRHKWFWARKLRARAGVCVGRPAGLFREHIYDRLFDDSKYPDLSRDIIERERQAQLQVLALAGVPIAQKGNVLADLGKTIAKRLPPMKNLR